MRIIGGELSGRRLLSPKSDATRPMVDRMREALFNILMHRDWGWDRDGIEGARVLDAFCGTGALAFEALSRGAAHATLFDKNNDALDVARGNAKALGVADRCKIMGANTLKPPAPSAACDLLFVCPPYHMKLAEPALNALLNAGWVAKDAVVLVQTGAEEAFELPPRFECEHDRTYGDTVFYFLRLDSPSPCGEGGAAL